MIVLDASATLAWLFQENDPLDWIEDSLANDHLLAPALWRLEVVNAVLKKERQKLITEEQGTAFVQVLDGLAVEIPSLCQADAGSTSSLRSHSRFALGHWSSRPWH